MGNEQKENKFKSGFFIFIDWYYKLVILNFTFLIFTIMGFGLFGLAPSIKASQYMIMKWINKEEPPLLKTFWSVYKKDFLYTYLTFVPYALGITLFSVTLSLALKYMKGITMIMSISGSVLFLFIFVVGLFFVFFFKNRYEIGFLRAIKYSFTLPFGRFGYLFLILVCQAVLFSLSIVLWAYLIFLNFGFSMFITEFFGHLAFRKIDLETLREKNEVELDNELRLLEIELEQQKKQKQIEKRQKQELKEEQKRMRAARRQALKELREEERKEKNDRN